MSEQPPIAEKDVPCTCGAQVTRPYPNDTGHHSTTECIDEATGRVLPPAERRDKPMPDAENGLGDLIAQHDAYRVNQGGWTVCICGHVAEGDDDDGSHARHVADILAEHLRCECCQGRCSCGGRRVTSPALADARRRPAMREDDFTNTPEDAAAYELLRGRDEYLGEHAQPIVKPFCSVCQGGVLGYVCGPCARDADFDWRGEQLRSWAL